MIRIPDESDDKPKTGKKSFLGFQYGSSTNSEPIHGEPNERTYLLAPRATSVARKTQGQGGPPSHQNPNAKKF